jgi:hypothetical protein
MAPKRVKSRLLELDGLSTIEDEFSSWDHEQCSGLLNSLRRPCTRLPELPASASQKARSRSGKAHQRDTSGFQVEDFMAGSTVNLYPEPSVRLDPSFVPPPHFETCTPTQSNIYIGDDHEGMPFRPFSDDPSFPFENYDDDYYALYEWQLNHVDPDCTFQPCSCWRTVLTHTAWRSRDPCRRNRFPLSARRARRQGSGSSGAETLSSQICVLAEVRSVCIAMDQASHAHSSQGSTPSSRRMDRATRFNAQAWSCWTSRNAQAHSSILLQHAGLRCVILHHA